MFNEEKTEGEMFSNIWVLGVFIYSSDLPECILRPLFKSYIEVMFGVQ